MPGTKTSNRCDTCAQRKVKCDEAWPSCGSCNKSRRICPGPPRKVIRWVHPRYTDSDSFSLEQGKSHAPSRVRDGPRKTVHMVTLRSKKLQNGDEMHKIRLVNLPMPRASIPSTMYSSPLLRSPAMSLNETLSCRVHTVLQSHPGNMLSHIGVLRELCVRFGISVALDDALLCLAATYEAAARGGDVSTWFDRKGYCKALRSVQKAIDDPHQLYSTETLASVAILRRLDAELSRPGQKQAIHVQKIHGKALSDMLLRRGFRKPHDDLELHLVIDCVLGDVQVKAEGPHASSFDTPDWEDYISSLKGSTILTDLYVRVFQDWVKWPAFLQDIAKLQVMPWDTPPPEQLMHRLFAVAKKLESLSCTMGEMLTNRDVCLTSPSMTHDPLVPEVYYFKIPYLAIIVAAHSFYTTLIYQMVIKVNSMIPDHGFASPTSFPSASPPPPERLFSPGSLKILPLPASLIARVRLANIELSQRVWMMYEQVCEWKPIGCRFLLLAMKISYLWAETPEMKQWVLSAGMDLDIYPVSNHEWEPRRVEVLCKLLSGDLSALNVELQGDGLEGISSRLRKNWDFDSGGESVD